MSEQEDALGDLGQAGVIDAIRWAWDSAVRSVLDGYEPATGHDEGWLGYTAHTIFRDRLDRVFSCDRFSLGENADPANGADIVRAGLSEPDIETFPVLSPRLVSRADLNGSPGWRYQEWRWLLAAHPHGKSDRIPWPQKSPTKQRVAAQPNPDENTLFELEELINLDEVALRAAKALTLDCTTLVAAHAIDRTTGQAELHFGRTKLNAGGGYAWHWRVKLGTAPPGGSRGARLKPSKPPIAPDTNAVPDAPVSIRREAAQKPDSQDGAG